MALVGFVLLGLFGDMRGVDGDDGYGYGLVAMAVAMGIAVLRLRVSNKMGPFFKSSGKQKRVVTFMGLATGTAILTPFALGASFSVCVFL